MKPRLPLLLYVSGASGSGKTTLARLLSEQLYVPHVSSDAVLAGSRLTSFGVLNRKAAITSVFVPTVLSMLRLNVSMVVDGVLYKKQSEEDIIEHLRPHAVIINIHTIAEDPIYRFKIREYARTDRGVVLSASELQARAEFHAKNLENTSHPLQLDVPLIEVNTTSDYSPLTIKNRRNNRVALSKINIR